MHTPEVGGIPPHPVHGCGGTGSVTAPQTFLRDERRARTVEVTPPVWMVREPYKISHPSRLNVSISASFSMVAVVQSA